MKTILVTGASGSVGRHILPRLVSQGYNVHALERGAKNRVAHHPAINWQSGNLLNGDIEELLAKLKPTHCLHLAWVSTEHATFWTSPENWDWVEATSRLCRAFYACGGHRFVGVGTCAEYEWKNECLSELTTAMKPASLYGQAKYQAFKEISHYAEKNACSYVWARLFYLITPDEPARKFIPTVIQKILMGQSSIYCANHQYDFIRIDDVVAALCKLLDSADCGPVNIATGKAHSLKEVAEALILLLKPSVDIQVEVQAKAQEDSQKVWGDINRLYAMVGFKAEDRLLKLLETVI